MKKFLMAAAALLLAATMSFGFAACSGDADTTGGGGQNQEQTGGGTGGGSDSGSGGQETANKTLTEAEWKTAIASYDTADNYDQLVDIYVVNGEQKQKAMHVETKRDGNVVVNLNQTTGSPATYACYVLTGADDVAAYSSSDGESWNSATLNDGEKQGILRMFGKDGFTEALYRTKTETEGEGKTIANMYSAFTYDESEGCYKAELNQLGEGSVNACTINVYAENKKLVKIFTVGYVTSSSDVPMCSETTMTFGGVELEEPQVKEPETPKTTLTEAEWKAALGAFKTIDNYAITQDVYAIVGAQKQKTMHMEAKRDGNMFEVLPNLATMSGYAFYVLDGDDIISYTSTDGETWSTPTTLSGDDKEQVSHGLDNFQVKDSILAELYPLVKDEGEDTVIDASVQGKTLLDLYSVFTYDASEGCYKAKLCQIDSNDRTVDTAFEYIIYAENGKIVKQVTKATMYIPDSPMYSEGTIIFGGVELELPKVGE